MKDTVINIDTGEGKILQVIAKRGEDGLPGKDGKDGKDGRDGVDGVNGKDGRDGIDGKDGLDGKNGKDGKKGKDGVDGKDGSPDSPEQIAEKINTLSKAIDFKVIKNFPDFSKTGNTFGLNTSNNITSTDEDLRFSLQFAQLTGYTKYTYTSGDLTKKEVFTDNTETNKLFNVDYGYSSGDISTVTVTRMSDSSTFTKTFGYSGGDLSSITIT